VSHVSTVIIISPYTRFPDKVNEVVTRLHHGDSYEEGNRFPALNSTMENSGSLFAGSKFPSGSLLWIGWNYFYIDDLLEELKPFDNLTVWYETEGEYMDVERINWNI
jgi:hypothetical protein